MTYTRHLLCGATVSAILLSTFVAMGQPAQGSGGASGGRAAPPPETPPISEEYLLLGDATRGSGEPMIAVDPIDPNTIVVIGMGNLLQLDAHSARGTIPWLAVTHDDGKSWKIGELPILDDKLVRCPDPMMDVTKDGIFIGGCEAMSVGENIGGKSAIVVSTDKADSWGPPAEMVSGLAPGQARFAAGLKPRTGGASPFDRPFTYIDDSTGVIYGQAGGAGAQGATADGTFHTQSYITASTDGGKSFGTIYSWDSKDYPQISRGQSLTAGHGEAAIVYVAGAAPAKETCPCVVMGITKNFGKTFEYHVLKDFSPVAGATTAAGANGSPVTGGFSTISSDFTKAGRYAILKYGIENGAPVLRVAVSEDHGKTWSPFTVAGTTPDALQFARQLSFQYGRNGVLAVVWRAVYGDGSYDLWSAISKDGGYHFSQPLRVSHARSPAESYHRSRAQNDDVLDFSMDRDNVHMVWADNRAGFLGTWYAKVALSSYKFP